MDKSFVSFLVKDESFKVYMLTILCYYTYSHKLWHGREKACDSSWWMKSKGVTLNNSGTSCCLKFIVQTISVTIAGIREK